MYFNFKTVDGLGEAIERQAAFLARSARDNVLNICRDSSIGPPEFASGESFDILQTIRGFCDTPLTNTGHERTRT